MTIALIVEFQIRSAHIEAFATAIETNARLSRETEPGCLQFDVWREPTDTAIFFLYELYTDASAVQRHIAAPHFHDFDALTAPWVVSKQVRTMVRTCPSA